MQEDVVGSGGERESKTIHGRALGENEQTGERRETWNGINRRKFEGGDQEEG